MSEKYVVRKEMPFAKVGMIVDVDTVMGLTTPAKRKLYYCGLEVEQLIKESWIEKIESPIDCKCNLPKKGYCQTCGGYLPTHEKHIDNCKDNLTKEEKCLAQKINNYLADCKWNKNGKIVSEEELSDVAKDHILEVFDKQTLNGDGFVLPREASKLRKAIEEC